MVHDDRARPRPPKAIAQHLAALPRGPPQPLLVRLGPLSSTAAASTAPLAEPKRHLASSTPPTRTTTGNAGRVHTVEPCAFDLWAWRSPPVWRWLTARSS